MSEFLKKEVEADDPMELQGIQFDGDPGYMIDCVVEEYARIGWPAEEILGLFESPGYPVLRLLLESRGKEGIRRSIERVVARCGIFRSRTVEAPEEPHLVTIEPLQETSLTGAGRRQVEALREGGQRDESGL
jgi:hypothetical protein